MLIQTIETDRLLFLVIVVVEMAGQAKIGHFDDAIVRQKDVLCNQITVKNLFAHEIIHSASDLKRPTDRRVSKWTLSNLLGLLSFHFATSN